MAIVLTIGILLPLPDTAQSEYAAAVLSVLGIGASVFIGFRNTTASNRWWEARTLWGGIIICSGITANLLGARHPLAAPPQGEKSLVWM